MIKVFVLIYPETNRDKLESRTGAAERKYVRRITVLGGYGFFSGGFSSPCRAEIVEMSTRSFWML